MPNGEKQELMQGVHKLTSDMSDEEKVLRRELRVALEKKADVFFDKYKHETKCLHVTDVMRALLEDENIQELQQKILAFRL